MILADFQICISVPLDKTMTTQEYCVKHDFVAPLTLIWNRPEKICCRIQWRI